MNTIKKILLPLTSMLVLFVACEKADELPFYKNGDSPTLSVSAASVSPTPADSNNTAFTLSWTEPGYAIDSAHSKYIVQIAQAGQNFAQVYEKELTGKLSQDYIAKEINNLLIDQWGKSYNESVNLEARVISSYTNNNDRLVSNILPIVFKTYLTPPKVNPPVSGELYLTGSAAISGWSNPVMVPVQKFTKVSNLVYELQTFMYGGAEYLILPENGNWDKKFAIADNTAPGIEMAGSFGYYEKDNAVSAYTKNFKSPAETGVYKISLDFQQGKYTVTQVSKTTIHYVVGTHSGWAHDASPKIGSSNDKDFEGYVYFPDADNKFKVTTQSNWDGTNYGAGATAGTLSATGGDISHSGAGYYRFNANTTDLTWSVIKTDWGVVGSATAGGWNNSTSLSYNSTEKVWTGIIALVDGEFKFRANNGWDINLGALGNTGLLDYGKDNIPVTAGSYRVILNLNTPGYYWYRLEKQ